MTIKQLSVFLENKTGRINEVAKVLAKNNINMHAFSMAETAEFGILRLIVSDIEKAKDVLQEASFAVITTDVVCINCPNISGSLSAVLEELATKDIFIEYMYAFGKGENANIVIKPTDVAKCLEVLKGCDCSILDNTEI